MEPAQTTSGAAEDIDALADTDIVVTANKRAERLLDVASAVSALSTDTLISSGETRMEDYLTKVPGISIANFTAGGGQSALAIRGISTVGGNPTVATFIDDAPFSGSTSSSVPDIDPADLERIEVLRGPQGTLYGAGAMGGVVKYVTKAPDTSKISGRIQIDGSTIDGGSQGYGLRAALNVPVSSTVAIRASGFKRKDGGFLDNIQTGVKNYNSSFYDGGRVAIGFEPSDMFKVELSASHQHIRARGNPNIDQDIATGRMLYGDLQTSRGLNADNSDSKYTFIALNIQGDMGWAKLTSVTSYQKAKFRSNFDYTPAYGPIVRDSFGIDGATVAIPSTSNLAKLSQEIRIGNIDGIGLDWQVGAFLTTEDSVNGQTSRVYDGKTGKDLTTPLPLLFVTDNRGKYEEIAGFGNVIYNFSSKFDITLGGRYSANKQRSQQSSDGFLFGGPSIITTRSSDSAFTWLINPRYKINDRLMTYARVATGYRAGGSNTAAFGIPATYGPDRVTNYEIGLKGDILNRMVVFDLSVFYIDWTKVQVRSQTSLGEGYFSNTGSAHSQGAEGSITITPVRGLVLAGNLSYVEAETNRNLEAPLVGVKGDWLPYVPRWTGRVSADYRFDLGNKTEASFGAAYSYVGKRFGAFDAIRTVLPSYDVINVHAGIRYAGVAIDVYANNLTDKRGRGGNFQFGPIDQISIIAPRTYGVSMSTNF